MKKLLRKWMVMSMASVLLSVFAINTSNAQERISLQAFYDELDPYGTWMEHRTYGYVWMPSVDRGFTPYATNGYWVQTEYGNTWVSDYAWGWAPFHYGRWFYDDFYGWIWVPDSEWAPAWVTWRSSGEYYGWAPLMPGLAINVSMNYYNTIPSHYWSFVPHRYVLYRDVHTHCLPRRQVVNVYNTTTIVTNNYNHGRRTTFFTGPSRHEIERTNRQRVDVYSVSNRSRPGRTEIERGRVNVYRPEVDNSRESRSRSVPARIARDERNARETTIERNRPAERRTTEISRQREADRMDQRRTIENTRRSSPAREVERQPVERQREVQREEPKREVVRQREEPKREVERQREVKREAPQRNFDQQRQQAKPQLERQNNQRSKPEVQRQAPARQSVEQRSQPSRNNGGQKERKRN